MAERPLASHRHESSALDATRDFLKRMRSELRMLRRVRVYTDRLQIFDVNEDYFEVENLGYPDRDIVPVLDTIGAAYKHALIHQPTEDAYKEFNTGRRYPWAQDRVM